MVRPVTHGVRALIDGENRWRHYAARIIGLRLVLFARRKTCIFAEVDAVFYFLRRFYRIGDFFWGGFHNRLSWRQPVSDFLHNVDGVLPVFVAPGLALRAKC